MKLHAKTYRLLDPRLWLLTKNEILENHFFDKTLSSNFFGAPEAGPPCSIFFSGLHSIYYTHFYGLFCENKVWPYVLVEFLTHGESTIPTTHAFIDF